MTRVSASRVDIVRHLRLVPMAPPVSITIQLPIRLGERPACAKDDAHITLSLRERDLKRTDAAACRQCYLFISLCKEWAVFLYTNGRGEINERSAVCSVVCLDHFAVTG